jgi:hypothetical protein
VSLDEPVPEFFRHLEIFVYVFVNSGMGKEEVNRLAVWNRTQYVPVLESVTSES